VINDTFPFHISVGNIQTYESIPAHIIIRSHCPTSQLEWVLNNIVQPSGHNEANRAKMRKKISFGSLLLSATRVIVTSFSLQITPTIPQRDNRRLDMHHPAAGTKRRCPVRSSTPLGPDQVNVLVLFHRQSHQAIHYPHPGGTMRKEDR
jgi:hypothetical protein